MSPKQPINLNQEKLVELMKEIYYKGQHSPQHLSAKDMVEEISGKIQTLTVK